MASAPPYDRSYSFLDAQTQGQPVDGNALNSEFDAISDTTNRTLEELARIQRSDGGLVYKIVGLTNFEDGVFEIGRASCRERV